MYVLKCRYDWLDPYGEWNRDSHTDGWSKIFELRCPPRTHDAFPWSPGYKSWWQSFTIIRAPKWVSWELIWIATGRALIHMLYRKLHLWWASTPAAPPPPAASSYMYNWFRVQLIKPFQLGLLLVGAVQCTILQTHWDLAPYCSTSLIILASLLPSVIRDALLLYVLWWILDAP